MLEKIAARAGKIVATNALALHRILQHEGEESARARFSSATYDRLWQVLVEARVITETTSEAVPAHFHAPQLNEESLRSLTPHLPLPDDVTGYASSDP